MNTLMLALKADQIDALVTADIVCKQAMAANPEFTVAEGSQFDLDFLNSPGAAVGIRKGSDALKSPTGFHHHPPERRGQDRRIYEPRLRNCSQQCQRGRSITKYPFCRIIHLGGLSCTLSWAECCPEISQEGYIP